MEGTAILPLNNAKGNCQTMVSPASWLDGNNKAHHRTMRGIGPLPKEGDVLQKQNVICIWKEWGAGMGKKNKMEG